MTEPDIQDTWKDTLRDHLNQMPTEERFVEAGELITWITYSLLPSLGAMRRNCIVDLVELHGWEVGRIVGHFGMSRSAVVRLLDEGRADRKYLKQQREAIVVLEPSEGA